MTDIATSRSPSGDDQSTAQVAKEQAVNVGRTAAEQGRQVAEEARYQARDLYGEARQQVRDQVGGQQQRAASGLRSVGDELRRMADQGGGSGPATELARRASGTVDQFAGWLEGREPGAVLDEVKRYARQHPGAFLAGAAVLGVLAGRLTRGLTAGAPAAEPEPDQGTLYAGGASGGVPGIATPVAEPTRGPIDPMLPGEARR